MAPAENNADPPDADRSRQWIQSANQEVLSPATPFASAAESVGLGCDHGRTGPTDRTPKCYLPPCSTRCVLLVGCTPRTASPSFLPHLISGWAGREEDPIRAGRTPFPDRSLALANDPASLQPDLPGLRFSPLSQGGAGPHDVPLSLLISVFSLACRSRSGYRLQLSSMN